MMFKSGKFKLMIDSECGPDDLLTRIPYIQFFKASDKIYDFL